MIPSESSSRSALAAGILLFLAIAWFYTWTAFPEGGFLRTSATSGDYYNLLVDGFRKGQLSLDHAVPAGLLSARDPYDPAVADTYGLHDASYYKGAFYLYFGVSPAVTLFWPFRALTGRYLSEAQAVVLFSEMGFAASLFLLLQLKGRYFPGAEFAATVAGAVALGLATMVPGGVLRRPGVWEVPIAAGYAYFFISLLCLFQALHSRNRIRWTVAASVAYGLTVGARPDYAFGAAALLVPAWAVWHAERANPRFWSVLARTLLAAVVPLTAMVGGLLVYNFLRFDSPFEFGSTYQMSGHHERLLPHFSPRFLWYNLKLNFLCPPGLGAFFPYVRPVSLPPAPSGYFGVEDPYGILPGIPFTLLALAVPFGLRGRFTLKAFCAGVLVAVLAIASTLFLNAGASNRYLLDFLPALVLFGCVGAFVIGSLPHGWKRALLGGLGVLLLLWSVAFNLLVSFGHNDLLRAEHPALYRRVARIGNYPSSWIDRIVGARYGPVDLTVRFPRDCTGSTQPLLATGMGALCDLVYVNYASPGSVVLGFDHLGYGGMTSPPIAVDYGRPHTIHIEMGSLYPPFEHPYFDGASRTKASARTDRIRISVDGKACLDSAAQFYDATSRKPLVGRSLEGIFGEPFTGEILGESR